MKKASFCKKMPDFINFYPSLILFLISPDLFYQKKLTNQFSCFGGDMPQASKHTSCCYIRKMKGISKGYDEVYQKIEF